ncbi:hypothetical protein Y032_0195g1479 [Ancylostoma ceylanicum]|uniref:Uncharacterized protein n=1 Tax=Ancylostoma ceylanicum TaxID=53326 RepID=A0A016SNW7_9BILA|nr:hypothetical protein Y032_0195g1479 [Ancylostoma ceylanicum]
MRTIELLLQTLEYLNTTRIFDTRHDYYWYDSQQSRFHCDYGTLSSADDVNDIPDECKCESLLCKAGIMAFGGKHLALIDNMTCPTRSDLFALQITIAR